MITPPGPASQPVPVPTPDLEVLPAPAKPRFGGFSVPAGGMTGDSTARLVANVMDSLLKIPGTKATVGINPFLDLVPIFGDSAAVIVSALTIVEGFRRGVPKIVLARMSLNVLLNGFIGMIPVAGEAFAFWYKPTSRNYQLLQQHAGLADDSTVLDWGFVIGLVIVVLACLSIFVGAGILILYFVIKTIYAYL